MVQQSEALDIIAMFKNQLVYNEGILYWASHMRLSGKEAGYKNKDGYIEIRIGTFISSKIYLAHRIIFAIHYDYIPVLVDHKDQNTRNNLIDNLRDASKTLNAINTGIPSNNTSGIKGVSLTKTGKWEVYINTKNNNKKVKIHLGVFNNIEDATKARQQAEKYYWNDIRGNESPISRGAGESI